MPPGGIAGDDAVPGAPLSGVQGAVNVPFHEVVDALDQLIVVLSASGDAEYVNRAGREYLGKDLLEARERWNSAIHTDDLAVVVRARTAGHASGSPWTTQTRMQRHDGIYRWFHARVTPLRDIAGNITHWTAAFTDVDDSRTLEERLREEKARVESFDELMPGVIVSFRRGPDGQVSFPLVSPRYFELTGVCAAALAADPKAGYAIVHPEDLPAVLAAVEHARQTQTPLHHVYRIHHPERGVVWLEAHSAPRADPDGGTTWHGTLHDVTARRAAERGLEESNARFKQLAESIEEVFWLTDVKKQRIVYISPGYEKIWGRTCQSVIDNPSGWLEAIHPDDRATVRVALEKQAAGKYDEEYRVLHTDGTTRWVHDKAFPVRDASGAVIGVAGVAQDVTERRALEMQLRQSQKLESIGSLAGGVAHDFNNWLTVIGGSTSLLLEKSGLDTDSAELLEEIRHASERATGLTRQLLAFSRKEIVEPQVVRMNDVVADAHRLLSRLLGEDVVLTTRLAENLLPVRVDKGQWSQVLINLAVNARDAMPQGGRLLLETRNVTAVELESLSLTTGPAAPHVLVEVTDSGTGMSPEVKARLFEPFFTTKGVGRGTGLGLAVVHGIVSQSGGHVLVESTIGTGSTFRLYIPALLAKSATLAPAAGSSALVKGGNETILIVEDEEALRRFVKRGLLRDGYRVLEAADGMDALDVVANHTGAIDLVLTDVVMPRLGGRELTRRLHELRPNLRVLYTTGYTDDAVLRHGVSEAEVALVAKPFTYSILRARIRELLDR